MADTNARLERLRHCNTAQGNTEPIIHHQRASAEMEEEEDLESSYILSGRTEPSLSFTATATSRFRSRSQLTPSPWHRSCCATIPLRAAVRGGLLELLSSPPSPTKTRP
jgi:hypothetical protein